MIYKTREIYGTEKITDSFRKNIKNAQTLKNKVK